MIIKSFASSVLRFRTLLLTLVVALALAAYGAYVPASAQVAVTPGSPGGGDATTADAPSGVTPAQVAAAVAEIKQSGQSYDTFTTDGQRYISVKFGTGSTLNLPDSGPITTGGRVSTPPRGVAPQLGGGGGFSDPYITFNKVDQQALIAGGGAALAGAICLVPVVGVAACAVAAVIVTIATTYVASYGGCPASCPTLRVYVYGGTFDGGKTGCCR